MSFILEALKASQKHRDEHFVDGVSGKNVDLPDAANSRSPSPSGRVLSKRGLMLIALLTGIVAGAWYAPIYLDRNVVIEDKAMLVVTDEIPAVRSPGRGVPASGRNSEVSTSSSGEVSQGLVSALDTGVDGVSESATKALPTGELSQQTRKDNARKQIATKQLVSSAADDTPAPTAHTDGALSFAPPSVKQDPDEKGLPDKPGRKDKTTGSAVKSANNTFSDKQLSRNLATLAGSSISDSIAPSAASRNQEDTGRASQHSGYERAIPHFRELPLNIQNDLPDIRFSVHLYSPQAHARLVKIDGWIRREGDALTPELMLDEIISTGAIFTFRGHRFRVPVGG